MDNSDNEIFDVFLSHSHKDAEHVEYFAERLADDENLNIWLDKWILIPGEPFRQNLAKGLETAKTCAVFVGNETPKGWFEEEISKALNRQTKDKSFRVIPILLPNAEKGFVNDFLDLRTWVDFKNGINDPRAFHELKCGIKGIKPGRKYISSDYNIIKSELEDKLRELENVGHLIENSVKMEIQKMILTEHFIKKDNK